MPSKQSFSPDQYRQPLIIPCGKYRLSREEKCAYANVSLTTLHAFLSQRPGWAQTACPHLHSYQAARMHQTLDGRGASRIKNGTFLARSRCGGHTLVYRVEQIREQKDQIKITPTGARPTPWQVAAALALLVPFAGLSVLALLVWALKYGQSYVDSMTNLTFFCTYVCYNEHIDPP